MNFQDLTVVETAAGYLDIALKAGNKKVAQSKPRVRRMESLDRLRNLERDRLTAIADSLAKNLGQLSEKFPSIDALPEFYSELVEETLGRERMKRALAATASASENARKMAREFIRGYGYCNTGAELLKKKRMAIGRLSSVMKRIDKELRFLKKARDTMRTYPAIKTDRFSVCIAGFPNVGKSTLLSRLTPARPEISNYAFTTKTLNVGYWTHRHNKLQFIDTPGSLNRLERLNAVEKQAYLAMKYVASLIIYVYDPTETYPLADQEALEMLVREYGKDVLIYLSKTDVARPEAVVTLRKKHPDAIADLEELKTKITEIFDKEYL